MTTAARDHAEVKDSLDRLVDAVEIPSPQLTQAAMAEGRQLRSRRRAIAAVGAVAAVTVVALAVPVANSLLSSPSRADAADAPREVAQNPEPTADTPPAQWWDMTAREMVAKLDPLLPAGSEVADVEYQMTDQAPGEEPGPYRGYLAMSLDTGGGPGGLNMLFYAPGTIPDPTAAGPQMAYSLRCPAAAGASCEERRDAAGNLRARLLHDDYHGVAIDVVTALGDDGVLSYLATSNSTNDKWEGPATIGEPPLTLDQMLAIVRADTWSH